MQPDPIENYIMKGNEKMRKRLLIMLAAIMLIIPAMSVSAAGLSQDNSNLNGTFDCIDGGTVSTQSGGKPKIIVFFKTTCGHCINTLREISSSDWIKNGETDVCAIEITGRTSDEVKQFRDTYCPEGMIKFGYDTSAEQLAGSMAFRYFDAAGNSGNTSGTPMIAMIDADNKLQAFATGYKSSAEIEAYLPDLLPAESPDLDNPGNPDNPDNPDNPGNPDNPSQTPGEDDVTEKPEETPGGNGGTEKPDDGLESQESGSSKAACNHVGEIVIVSNATAASDAVAAYQCVKCGTVYKYEAVANSAYAAFLKETADAISNTKEKEVVINTRLWTSFNKTVFEAMKNRPDVAVTVNYWFEGNPYVLTIPAGTDVSLLMDENGFGGFRYIESVLGM